MQDKHRKPTTRGLWLFNWTVLLLGLPLAFFAAAHAPNEYKATLGIDALDCQGPFETYMLAVPALALYCAGSIFNGLKWRQLAHLVVAALCVLVCGAVAINVVKATKEEQLQRDDCVTQ